MKRKDILITLFGVTCIVSGLSIFGAYYYFNTQMTTAIKNNIANSTIFVHKVADNGNDDSSTVNSSVSTLVDLDTSIESVDEDQVIETVKTYTNVLEIPELDILAYVNEGSDKAALSGGVGHHTGTADIGEAGNCVIAGHASATYNCIFNNLENINLLDSFYLYDEYGTKHKYYVTSKFICDPGETSILYNSGEGISTTTIYTCTNKGQQRFVVIGKEFNEDELTEFSNELKNTYITNMLRMNDSVSVEKLTNAFAVRGYSKARAYDVKYFNIDTEAINKALYGVVLGSDAFDKVHIYDTNYSCDFGFILSNINGGSNNDISEN